MITISVRHLWILFSKRKYIRNIGNLVLNSTNNKVTTRIMKMIIRIIMIFFIVKSISIAKNWWWWSWSSSDLNRKHHFRFGKKIIIKFRNVFFCCCCSLTFIIPELKNERKTITCLTGIFIKWIEIHFFEDQSTYHHRTDNITTNKCKESHKYLFNTSSFPF